MSTTPGPESSAARVAMWRALHAECDPQPHVIEDRVGLELLAPAGNWRRRPDMNLAATAPFRASIVARARFVEDMVEEAVNAGVSQYVLLGAGLDSLAQRRPDLAEKLSIFEIDQPRPQSWKRQRLIDLGYVIPDSLHFVPVDFESGKDWRHSLVQAGFDVDAPAIVSSTGVSMYLTKQATTEALRKTAALASGSTFIMSFLLPLDQVAPGQRKGVTSSAAGARASGTPFISFFLPDEIMELARDCGFGNVTHVSADDLASRYFSGRFDGLRPPSRAEEIIVGTT